jgi:hypothetical protein
MNRLFYVIYNSYYKDGQYKDDIPSLTVGGIFTISFFSIGLSIFNLIGWINPLYSKIKIGNFITFFSISFCALIVYFLFYHNKRYRKIYQTYKNNVFLNSKLAKRFSFFIVILFILSPIILVMIQTKIHYGWWIKFS